MYCNCPEYASNVITCICTKMLGSHAAYTSKCAFGSLQWRSTRSPSHGPGSPTGTECWDSPRRTVRGPAQCHSDSSNISPGRVTCPRVRPPGGTLPAGTRGDIQAVTVTSTKARATDTPGPVGPIMMMAQYIMILTFSIQVTLALPRTPA